MQKQKQNNEKCIIRYVKFTNQLSLKTRYPKRTGGKWLIHGTKHRKDNKLQSQELPCRIA